MTPRSVSIVGIADIAMSVTTSGEALNVEAIDRLIERSMARWEVPAVAVAAIDR